MTASKKLLHVAVIAEAQWGLGRGIVKGVIRSVEKRRPRIVADLIGGEIHLTKELLSSYDGILEGRSEPSAEVIPEGLPVVAIDASNHQDFPRSAPIDHEAIGALAAETLHAEGVVSYGFFDGFRGEGQETDARSAKRFDGFRKGLLKCGVDDIDTCLHIQGTRDFAALREWVRELPKPAGVFAYNDPGCLEVAEACRLSDFAVPRQVALIGVDNDQLLCSLCRPPLSSIDPGVEAAAFQAMEVLVGLMESKLKASTRIISPQPRVFLRESTGKCSTDNQKVKAALNVIGSNITAGPLSVGQVASQVGVSLRGLEVLFKKHLGTTIQHEVLQARLKHFKLLLRTTSLTIEQISEQLHLEPSSLRLSFKQSEGISPAVYRRRFSRKGADFDAPNVITRSTALEVCFFSSLNGQAAVDNLRGAEEYARKRLNVHLRLRLVAPGESRTENPFSQPIKGSFLASYDGFIAGPKVEMPSEVIGKKPVVYIDHQRRHPLSWSVEVDNFDLGRLAAEHFLSKGYQRFVYCGNGDQSIPVEKRSMDSRDELRFQGFRDTLLEAGIPKSAVQRCDISGQEVLIQGLKTSPAAMALFAFNDSLAIDLLRGFEQAGVRVPEDIALLGADNDDLFCNLTPVRLSSIDLRFQRIGYQTVETLVSALKGKGPPPPKISKVLPRSVVERDSTQGVASSDSALTAAIAFIASHHAGPVKIQDIVAESGVSRRTLENRFQAAFNRSILSFLNFARINTASDLLTRTAFPVGEIASKSGFKHARHFCHLFKKQTGQTPLALRHERGSLLP